MEYISSVHNDQIKHLKKLQDKAYRYEHQQFVMQGTRACSEFMQIHEPIAIYTTEIYCQSNALNLDKYIDKVTFVADHLMEKISTSSTPCGICMIFAIPAEKTLPTQGPGLVLVDISDPGNMGTLIRTAAAMNINHVIIIGGTDPYSPKVVQSTAGCFSAITLYQTTFEQLAQTKLNLCALVVKDGQTADQINLSEKFLVVGNEAHGLTKEQVAACLTHLTIPMPGHVESLNAAIAGAIGLYIMATQR